MELSAGLPVEAGPGITSSTLLGSCGRGVGWAMQSHRRVSRWRTGRTHANRGGIGSQSGLPMRSVHSAARVLFESVVFDIREIFESNADSNRLFGLVV